MVKFTCPVERLTADWEARHVTGRDASRVDVRGASAVAAYALQLAGEPCKPPVVTYVGPDDPGYVSGARASISYDGLSLSLHQRAVPSCTVLHEVAHLLTEDPLDCMELRALQERPMHGPLFLQNYLWLLGRCMGPAYNPFYLRGTMPAQLEPARIPHHPVVWGKSRADLA